MTDYMLKLAMELLGNPASVQYVDLGSGAGGAAVRLLSLHPTTIAKATCVNLCAEQNAAAMASATTATVQDRIAVVTNTYDETPFGENTFDFSFSQDAYVHSFSKVTSYGEAFRVTKAGGIFVFCDLMAGTGPDVNAEEYETFAQTNMVNDFLNPADNVKACEAAGWTEVKFVDLTVDIKISFQLYVMLLVLLWIDYRSNVTYCCPFSARVYSHAFLLYLHSFTAWAKRSKI
jgi:sarcosine/dimethylglycine N-methyltransferase